MHALRAVAKRDVDVPHHRQLFEVQFAGLGDVLGLGAGRCQADRDHLANEANAVAGQGRILGVPERRRRAIGHDRTQGGQVGRQQHARSELRGNPYAA